MCVRVCVCVPGGAGEADKVVAEVGAEGRLGYPRLAEEEPVQRLYYIYIYIIYL